MKRVTPWIPAGTRDPRAKLGRFERAGAEFRADYRALFNVADDAAEPMLFRLGRAEAPTARALHRHVDEVLVFE